MSVEELPDPVLWVSGIVRLPLLDADDTDVGRIADVVLRLPGVGVPTMSGMVATVDRRRIFVHVNRVASVHPDGVRLRGGTVDLRRFRARSGEMLVEADLVGTRSHGSVVADASLRRRTRASRPTWELHELAVRPRGVRLRRGRPRTTPWRDLLDLFAVTDVDRHAARLEDMHKADAAERLRALAPERRAALVEALADDRLADLLEELPEADQIAILRGLDVGRVADVIDEMEPDDAVDLLRELPRADREQVLSELPDAEADELRGLLRYDQATAGGLMTSEAIVVEPGTSVAEVLSRMRSVEGPPALAARVFIAEPPADVPSGPYLGCVGFRRMLREPPSRAVGEVIDEFAPTVHVTAPEREVLRALARYDLLSVAVLDDDRRVVGAVTVDDVLAALVEQAALTRRPT